MYTAVIVEPRIHPSLFIVLNNFNNNLDNKWSFLIFHGLSNKEYIENIFNTIQTKKKCVYVNLNKINLTIKEYNQLLYSSFFYKHIKTEHFLIFQTDTLLSKIYSNNIYKFLEYDYVGAPWKHRKNEVGNGGLSLRRKSKMLELLNKNFTPNVLNINEDLFFSGSKFNINNINIHKPSLKLAKEFSTESVFSNNSFGLHKPWLSQNNKQLDILKIIFPELTNLINTLTNYNKIVKKNKPKFNVNKPKPKIQLKKKFKIQLKKKSKIQLNKSKIQLNKLNRNKIRLNSSKIRLNIMKTNKN